ncbi:hypothetical protein [Bacillus cereus]|uniref:hypothetical protein n=1 Tax=Bacillus cereus TaxID=1396 RepID=UPI001F3FB1CB|nr:hypothetical protein [Bacillus cereus]BCC15221.1 hypothetical protein BCM0074_p56 [Bacillus cereus]
MRKAEMKPFLNEMDSYKLSPTARLLYLVLEISGSSGKLLKNKEVSEMTGINSSDTIKKAAAELESVKLIDRKIRNYGVEYTLLQK